MKEFLAVFIIALETLVNAFPDGAPSSACQMLRPVHGSDNWSKELKYSPFKLETSEYFCPGAPSDVQMTAKIQFKGILLLALAHQQDTPFAPLKRIPFGTWINYDEEIFHGLSCGTQGDGFLDGYKTAVTHNSNKWKQPGDYIFKWLPSKINFDNVQWVKIVAIVVTEFVNYYEISDAPVMSQSCEMWRLPTPNLQLVGFEQSDLYCDGIAYETVTSPSFTLCGHQCLFDHRCQAFAYSDMNNQCFLREQICDYNDWRPSMEFHFFLKRLLPSFFSLANHILYCFIFFFH